MCSTTSKLGFDCSLSCETFTRDLDCCLEGGEEDEGGASLGNRSPGIMSRTVW